MKKFKYSYKQMWSFARKSKSLVKQNKWLKRLYTQKIKIAERKGEYTRAEYLRIVRSKVRQRISARIPIRAMNWKIVGADSSNLEKVLLLTGGEKAKNNILIYDDKAGTKLIAYEGTEIYDEIIQAKKEQFGDPETYEEMIAKLDEGLKNQND